MTTHYMFVMRNVTKKKHKNKKHLIFLDLAAAFTYEQVITGISQNIIGKVQINGGIPNLSRSHITYFPENRGDNSEQ